MTTYSTSSSSNAVLRNRLFNDSAPQQQAKGMTEEEIQRKLAVDIERFKITNEHLEESSQKIKQIHGKYFEYQTQLSKIKKTMALLKLKVQTDQAVYYVFYLFLFVAGFIFLKRIGAIWVLKKCMFLAQKVFGYLFHLIGFFVAPKNASPVLNEATIAVVNSTVEEIVRNVTQDL
jgi:Sec20